MNNLEKNSRKVHLGNDVYEHFTKKDFEDFKEAYRNPENHGLLTFMFKNNEYHRGFAKYLIQYLTEQFKD